MRRELTLTTMAVMLIALSGGVAAYGAPAISFLEPPTPADAAVVTGSSVEIEAQIVDPALASVTFNWAGTNYVIYDDSVVLMFNCDNVAALGEDYTTPGGLVADASNSHNDGTVGIGDDPESVPEWLAGGRYGGAFDFAGNGSTFGQSILVIPHDSSLNPDSGDFAIAMWVRPRSDIDGDLLRKGSTATASTWYKLEHSPSPSNNRFSLNFNTDGTDATVTSPQAYNDDQWHYVLAQRSGNTAELWIDGSLVGSAGVSGSISNSANLTVGSKDDQADDFINATLDEVRIYMRSFTEDHIQVLYNSNLSKADQDTWYFYVNQTNLTGGTYAYEVSAANTLLEPGAAGRSVTMDAPAVTANIIKGPYLQQVSDSSIVIMWETDVAAESRVDFGLAGPDEYFVEDLTPVTIHEMWLTGLADDTIYDYTVTSGTTTSPASTFGTAPLAPRTLRFVAYGDTRSQPAEHASVVTAIINSAPEIVVHTGDLITDGTVYSLWETEFFGPASGLMMSTPMLPILGNHENNASWFYDLFSLPNNEQWYAFTYGNVRFIGLNTCTDYSTGSSQYNWLVDELQSTAYNEATWHIVYFHHPPYSATSSHGDDTNVQAYLVPEFELYGVDIVFNGHSHAYERYFHNGIYYIVTGGGGAPLANLVTDTKEPIRQVGESVYHHCTIDVDLDAGSLTVAARYNNGVEFDGITIAKTPKATNPNPADEATGVSIGAILSWSPGIDATSHDVYFGTTDPPPFEQSQDVTIFDPGTMANETTYFWRIDEYDGVTTHQGYVWSFTTVSVPGQASNPNPSDGAADVSTDADLSWTAGNDVTSHDVYFGADSNPPLVSQGQTGTTYDPGTLANITTYYWRIDEAGPGGMTPGAVWSFTTRAEMPWSDDFESGDLAAGGWAVSGIAAASTKAAYSGVYGAEIKDSAWIERAISTEGFADIHVKYARKTKGLDSGEFLYVEWWDGNGWTGLEATQSTSWASQDMPCGPAASDNAAFKVRFRSDAGNPSECGYIDNVQITGTVSGPDTMPPTPDPMTWAVQPYATGSDSVSMTAATASDPSGVEYYFDETSGNPGGTDSAWQDSATYVDTGLQADIEYTYQVQARDKSPSQNETAWSVAASATPQDVPPAAPTGLSATPGDAQVALDWDDNTETDLDGYNVYRSETPGGPYTKLNGALVTASDYLDLAVVNGTTYYYVVTAVDQASNESAYSTDVSATPSSQQTVSVASITMDVDQSGKKYLATASVTITPSIEGATVVGDWYFKGVLRQAGATGDITDGVAFIISMTTPAKSGDTFTFVVTDVIAGGYVYNPPEPPDQASIAVQ